MRKILTFFFILITNNSYLYSEGFWYKVVEIKKLHTFYVNTATIKETNGYVYFWELIDYSTLDEYGDHSARILVKGDCEKLRFKWIKIAYHKLPMAKDSKKEIEPSDLYKNWQYPKTASTSRLVLDFACSIAGIST